MRSHDPHVHDQKLVRRDAALPGLGLVLDEAAFAGVLGDAYPERRFGRPEITYVRYKPRTNCLVGYRVAADGEDLFFCAKAHHKDANGRLRKALQASPEARLIEPKVTVSPLWGDRGLELGPFADEGARKSALKRLLPDHPELWGAGLRPLRYKPERRFVAQLAVGGAPRGVLKLYDEEGFAAARRGARGVRPDGPLRLAQLLGEDERLRALVYRWRSSPALDAALRGGTFSPENVQTVGAALAALHAQEGRGLTLRPRKAEVRALLAAAEAVAWTLPDLGERARRLAQCLAAELCAAPPLHAPTHGDFSADQVLLEGDGTAFIDFDAAALGDPAWDLGSFAADLAARELPNVEGVVEALLEGYEAARGTLPERIRLYTAAGLLRLAPQPFRAREADWPARTEAILERAEALLAPKHRGGPRAKGEEVAVEDPFGVLQDPKLSFVRGALEPETVLPLLREALEAHGVALTRLRAVRVMRHKPGRRLLIAYDLETPTGPMTVLGKVRAKGTDRRTHRLQEALYANGFDDKSPDGVSVPQPLGVIPPLRMTLQRAVPGTSARELLGRGDLRAVRLAGRVAEAVHKLHDQGVPFGRVHTLEDELAILHKQLGALGAAQPRLAPRLERLLGRCEALAARLPTPRPAGVHRDFYPEQVLMDPTGRLYLLDLDLYCVGDPALDAGNFVGHLTEQALRTHRDPAALRLQEEALTARFCELSGASLGAVRIYSTLTLARLVAISQRLPERRSLTGALLALCEARLEEDLEEHERALVTG